MQTDKDSLSCLFDKLEGEWTWGTLEEEARKSRDDRWVDELATAIHRFVNGNPPHSLQATYRARGDNKHYRPVLYRVDTLADGSAVFKVLFHEDVSCQLVDVPFDIGLLITSLSMATRFRFEMIDRYREDVLTMNENAFAEACESMSQTLASIEEEADSRGLLERDGLLKVFKMAKDQTAVDKMYSDWYGIRKELLVGLEERDRHTVKVQLDKLQPINRGYLKIASRHFAELMAVDGGALSNFSLFRPVQLKSKLMSIIG